MSSVVCYIQELSRISKRATSLASWIILPGWRCIPEAVTAAWGSRKQGSRKMSETGRIPSSSSIRALRVLSWVKETSKLTHKLATSLCSFTDPGRAPLGARKAALQCVPALKCWLAVRYVTCLLYFLLFQCLLDFRHNVLQHVLESCYNLIWNSWGRDRVVWAATE